ncbi:MAG: tyrosine-type recombinase/integrase, partial [Ruthenibacterium sp.]
MAKLNTRKRGSTWEYRFEIASIAGKRKHFSKGGFPTKAQAQASGTKAMNEYHTAGEVLQRSNMSFADYLTEWQNSYCLTLVENTQKGYEKNIRLYIIPKLGAYSLSALTPAILEKFLFEMYNEGYSHNTLIQLRSILSGSLKYAVKSRKLLVVNPADDLNINFSATPDVPTRTNPHDFIPTKAEWENILQRFPEGSSAHIPLLLAYRCGLRLGEIFGLTWDDINFENGTLSVQRQMQHSNRDVVFVPPKYLSYRTIRIDDSLLELLARTKKQQEALREGYSEYLPSYYITNIKNNRYNHGTLMQFSDENAKEIYPVLLRSDGTLIQDRTTQHCSSAIHHKLGYGGFDFHSLRVAH